MLLSRGAELPLHKLDGTLGADQVAESAVAALRLEEAR